MTRRWRRAVAVVKSVGNTATGVAGKESASLVNVAAAAVAAVEPETAMSAVASEGEKAAGE